MPKDNKKRLPSGAGNLRNLFLDALHDLVVARIAPGLLRVDRAGKPTKEKIQTLGDSDPDGWMRQGNREFQKQKNRLVIHLDPRIAGVSPTS